MPSAIYVWLVPSEEVQEQPGSWRIRKWDTAPFHEANYTLSAPSEIGTSGEVVAALRQEPPSAIEPLGRLTKQAQVGNTRFGIGVSERMVVERAQREFVYQSDPKIEVERLQKVKAFVDACQLTAQGLHAKADIATVLAILSNRIKALASVPSAIEPFPLPPKDASGKRPRLFYWEEAEDCWCPADGYELTVANIIDVDLFLSDGEEIEICFKRQDMTDEEHAAIPEG